MGVVAALSVEARALGQATRRTGGLSTLTDGTLVALSGMGSAAATTAAEVLVGAGARGLMSFGFAGGLDPDLRAGSIVVPSAVISRDGEPFPTSPDWRARLVAALGATKGLGSVAQGPVIAGTLLTSEQVMDTLAVKAAAFRDTGAVAVDMESLAVAKVAAVHSLPFIAVRVIVDTAADVLPRAVVAASAGGQVRIGRLLGELALAPVECLAMLRLARRYRAATRAMAAVAADIRAA
jgi:adenosylhomocysteine nucleosidase